MKTLITALLLTTVAHAHVIQGTMPRYGKVKGSTIIRGVEVKCEVEINGPAMLGIGGKGDVRNLLKEDQFGNPAYKVIATVKLKSKEKDLVPVDFDEKITFSNLHPQGVSDSDYATLIPEAPAPTPQRPNPVAPKAGTPARFSIDGQGNIIGVSVRTNIGPVSCSF